MHETGFEQEGPANEATIGAQINADDAADHTKVDYYNKSKQSFLSVVLRI
jgi:ATP-dependent helicase STH1/SNF2